MWQGFCRSDGQKRTSRKRILENLQCIIANLRKKISSEIGCLSPLRFIRSNKGGSLHHELLMTIFSQNWGNLQVPVLLPADSYRLTLMRGRWAEGAGRLQHTESVRALQPTAELTFHSYKIFGGHCIGCALNEISFLIRLRKARVESLRILLKGF